MLLGGTACATRLSAHLYSTPTSRGCQSVWAGLGLILSRYIVRAGDGLDLV